MMDPSRWRIGARAVLVDLALAALAMVLAYQLRFGAAEALHFMSAAAPVLVFVLLLQLGLCSILKLYRLDGQTMWPVRLGFGTIAGAALTLAGASWFGIDDGVSRQAVAIQAALLCLAGVLWRAVVGLKFRQYQAATISEQFGGQELVVQGEDVGSMAGSLGRTWDYRHLLWNIVAKDLKLKYQRSLLGFAWSLLNPLMMIGVYTLAFTYVMKLPTPRFALFILIGLLSWNFFAGAVIERHRRRGRPGVAAAQRGVSRAWCCRSRRCCSTWSSTSSASWCSCRSCCSSTRARRRRGCCCSRCSCCCRCCSSPA